MFGKRTAQALDNTAAHVHDIGTGIAGETGGRVADAISNTVIAPIRSRIDEPCTCSGQHDHE